MSGSKQHLGRQDVPDNRRHQWDWTRSAVELAGMGAELFLTYRNKARADETIAEIRQKTGNDKIHLLRNCLKRGGVVSFGVWSIRLIQVI
jgi:hypothetical protein